MKKITLKITVELDDAAYADGEGLDRSEVRDDLASYVQTTLNGSHSISQAGGTVTVR